LIETTYPVAMGGIISPGQVRLLQKHQQVALFYPLLTFVLLTHRKTSQKH
jgi:hypothetical protein